MTVKFTMNWSSFHFFPHPPLPSTLTEIFLLRFTFFCESPPSHLSIYLSTSTVLCQIGGKSFFLLLLCEFFSANVFSYSRGSFSEDWIDLSTHIFRAVTSPILVDSIFILFDFMVYTQCHVIAMIHQNKFFKFFLLIFLSTASKKIFMSLLFTT